MRNRRRTSLEERWHSLKTAAWLGWQIESNWTQPWIFAVYSVAKPLALAAIVVVFATVTRSDFRSPFFSCMFVGNAFYMYVGAVMTGMAHAVLEDRERYRMLKTMYVAPVDIRLYLVGRGVTRYILGSISVAITILFGVLFLHVSIDASTVNWPLFVLGMILGAVMLASMGLILSGISLLTGDYAWTLGETVSGAFFLVSGAIFPLDVSPNLLKPLGLMLPITYWLDLLRRALIGPRAQAFPTLADFGDLQVLGILASLTATLCALSILLFNRCDLLARERGLIDRTSNY